MRVFRVFILIVLLTLPLAAQAGSAADSLRLDYVVRGRVLDARSGRALAAAHVSVPGKNYATVTNEDGSFVLRSDEQIGEVLCSYLGYRSARAAVTRGQVTVRLRQDDQTLHESFVISGEPKAIMMAAIDRIWDTYCTEPELLECFYRETLQKRGRYTYVAEAVSRLYKYTYNGSVFHDAAALEKSRVLVSQRSSDTLSVKTQGGPNQALVLDAVKNNEVVFNRRDMDMYAYIMESPVSIGDRPQIVISFKPAMEAPYPLYFGTVYIDSEFLTFTRIELSLDMSDPVKAARQVLVRKPVSLRFTPEELSVVINYSFKEGQSRLEYLRTTLRFACDWRKKLFRTRYTAVNEMVITDVRKKAVGIPRGERFRPSDILSDKAAEFSDPLFWEGYNIIEPSESLEHAISRLRKARR